MPEDGQYGREQVARINKTNKICCGWRQHLRQF